MTVKINHPYFEGRMRIEADKRGIKSLTECIRIVCLERVNETDRVAGELANLSGESTQAKQSPPDGQLTE